MSVYFTKEEFRCRSGAEYPNEWHDRLTRLTSMLDVIRSAWGAPLTVVCGYRDPAYNVALYQASEARAKAAGREHGGVAKFSQHIVGWAADIRPSMPTEQRNAGLHGLVRKLFDDGRIPDLGGLGRYAGWVHVDCRPKPLAGYLATWVGDGEGSEK